MESKFIYLLDAGHGGMIDGEYVTPGKRSPKWPDGTQYFEGVGNRAIRKKLANMLDEKGIAYHFVSAGNEDTNLNDRVDVINSFCRMYGANRCVLISIHSNGFTKPQANGWSVFTTKGTTKSDEIASIVSEETKKVFSNDDIYYREDKRDGDVDKEANFYIIANSKCRAVLTENFFHTNPEECKEILMTEEGKEKIAIAHFNTILRVEKEVSK